MRNLRDFLMLAMVSILVSCSQQQEEPAVAADDQTAQSSVISKNEAISTASRAMIDFGFATDSRSTNDVKSTEVIKGANSDTLMYIVNFSEGGFTIVNAQKDASVEVIGIADEGELRQANMPPAAAEYLADTGGRLPITPIDTVVSSIFPELDPVTYPVVKTYSCETPQWGQGYPYNVYCPQKKDGNGVYQNCLTGCGAVALCEIYAYHKDPATQSGYTMYWDEMLASSSIWGVSARAREAIAHLMYGVGVEASTSYGLTASSTTTDGLIHSLHVKGYANVKQTKSTNEVFQSLQSHGPVLVTGKDVSKKNGHAWVADGYKTITEEIWFDEWGKHLSQPYYKTRNYLHFNWGWSGTGNGYFITSENFDTGAGYIFRNDPTYVVNIYK